MDKRRSNKNISLGESEVEILIAGAGGQGILLSGKVLSLGFLIEDKEVSWFPSYGAEVRGGTCKCMVVASESEISSPYITHPYYLIVMNEPSYNKYYPTLVEGGTIFYNQTLIKDDLLLGAKDKNIPVPATDIASELGDMRCTNMVMLGAFIKHTGILKPETLSSALDSFVKNEKILKIDKEALKRGFDYV